jgi:Dyp-type peroxidase family
VTLEIDQIQGNVLHGYRLPKVAHLFASVTSDNLAACRNWLKNIQVTPAMRWGAAQPRDTLNIGLSYAAIAALLPDKAQLISSLFKAFAQGMRARAHLLGDPLVDTWAGRDVWICIHAKNDGALKTAIEAAQQRADQQGIQLSPALRGAALVEGDHWYEHFGFRDDISNPVVEDTEHLSARADARLLAGNGKKDQNGKWVPLAPGEFVLGYPNESKEIVPTGDLADLFKNGTFAVFRQLQQHVGRFNDYIEQTAEKQQIDPDTLAAKMLGRRKDGTPLAPSNGGLNDFDFESDKDGFGCPFGAHIRRANPREPSPVAGGRHRMIRRGIPYGEWFVAKTNGASNKPPEPSERGLYFVGLNANIEEQFEFIQRRWFNDRAAEGIDDRDPLVGIPPGKRTLKIEGHKPPLTLFDIPEFVTFRGGEYYFMPGLSGLQLLADGT